MASTLFGGIALANVTDDKTRDDPADIVHGSILLFFLETPYLKLFETPDVKVFTILDRSFTLSGDGDDPFVGVASGNNSVVLFDIPSIRSFIPSK
jgi:hypothetical protein